LNWRELNKKLPHLSETELHALLEAEVAGERRVSFLERIHQRYASLRTTRERLELFKMAKAP